MPSSVNKSDLSTFNPSRFTQEKMFEINKGKKKYVIGIPKSNDSNERRIPITPQGTEILTQAGFEVKIECGAGSECNYSDLHFSEMGAHLVNSKEEVFNSDIIISVSPLAIEEISFLKPYQTVISLIQLHQQRRELIQAMMHKRINAIGFELLQDDEGNMPIIQSMNEIEGFLAMQIAAEYLSCDGRTLGKGVLLGGITGIPPTEVVILGANTAGENAARAALGFGATVKIFDNSISDLAKVEHKLGRKIFTSILNKKAVGKALSTAEVVIGNLRFLQHHLSYMVSEDQVKQMKNGAVIIDLSIGQGGCFETSSPTTVKDPTYEKHGVVHYCAPNMASHVPRTASIALSNIITSTLMQVAGVGCVDSYINNSCGFSNGVYIYKGVLTNQYIGNTFDLPYKDIGMLMATF